MEQKDVVIIRRKKHEKVCEQKQLSHELCQVAELRQRFGITRPDLVARVLRISEARARELLTSVA